MIFRNPRCVPLRYECAMQIDKHSSWKVNTRLIAKMVTKRGSSGQKFEQNASLSDIMLMIINAPIYLKALERLMGLCTQYTPFCQVAWILATTW